MGPLQRGLFNLRAQLIERSGDIKREGKLTSLVFGPLNPEFFVVTAIWNDGPIKEKSKEVSVRFDRSSFVGLTPRCAQLKGTYCEYADEIVLAVKRARGIPI